MLIILIYNIHLIYNEKIEGFKTLDDDINEIRIQMKKSGLESIEEYLDKYKYIAKNMKRIFKKY